jgi:hypothetical protein
MAFNNNSYFHYIKITTGSSEYYEHLEHCCKIVNNYINTQVEFVNACGISLFLRHWIWIWTESASEKTKLPFERRCRYVYYCPLLPIYIHTGTHSWALRFFVEVQHVESQKFQNSNCRLQFEDINNFPNLNWLHTWPRPDTCGGSDEFYIFGIFRHFDFRHFCLRHSNVVPILATSGERP